MKDLFPKFIIENDNLIMMKVSFHKDIAIDKKNVKGGGWFKFNSADRSFTFYGESVDFGKAKMQDVIKCVQEKKIFTNPHFTRNISEDFNFFYDTGSEIINLKTQDNDRML